MRLLTTLVLLALSPLGAQTSDEKDAIAAAQKTFDGMAAHDAAMIRSSMLPDARLYSARDDGAVAPGTAVGDFADRIAAIKESIVERFTERPSVLAFHKEFSIFTVTHDYKSQTEVLVEAFDALKEKRRSPP